MIVLVLVVVAAAAAAAAAVVVVIVIAILHAQILHDRIDDVICERLDVDLRRLLVLILVLIVVIVVAPKVAERVHDLLDLTILGLNIVRHGFQLSLDQGRDLRGLIRGQRFLFLRQDITENSHSLSGRGVFRGAARPVRYILQNLLNLIVISAIPAASTTGKAQIAQV